MTGGRKPQLGEVVAFARAEHDRADDLLGAVVPARMREEPQARAASVLDNVVPFVRPRSNDNARPAGPELALPASARPAPMSGPPFGIGRRAVFIALSLLVHGSIFAALWREPAAMHGTELEAITVELVPPGSNTPVGMSQTPDEKEGVAQAGQVTETPDEKPPVQAEEPTTAEQPDVKVAEQEAAPEQPVAQQPAPEPPQEPEPPREVVVAPPEPEQAPQEPRESIAMVESPQAPEIATEAPRETPPPEPEKLTLLPQAPPEEKPVEPPKLEEPPPPKPVLREPEPEPKKSEPKKPEPKKPEQAKKPESKPKPKAEQRTRIAARTAERTVERPAGPQQINASNGTGIGAAARANYASLVSAHLRRHHNNRSTSGESGTVNVAFTLSGSGGVTSVRILKSSGSARIDEEMQATVRRASPFPPPPPGADKTYYQSVRFGSQ